MVLYLHSTQELQIKELFKQNCPRWPIMIKLQGIMTKIPHEKDLKTKEEYQPLTVFNIFLAPNDTFIDS